MENMTFEEIFKINCFSNDDREREKARNLLEWRYCCEIHCREIDESVIFAHHARGCTIIAAKICENVIIYQNVTIGSNMKYNKIKKEWENIGNPIISENVIIGDGAKILGRIIIGENTVISAGAIITKDIPANSIAYGINKYRPKDLVYDYIYNENMISGEEMEKYNKEFVMEFNKSRGKKIDN